MAARTGTFVQLTAGIRRLAEAQRTPSRLHAFVGRLPDHFSMIFQ